jgi:uncharacterized protein YndB with AHSA1/START domain
MSGVDNEIEDGLVFEYDVDAPPEMVKRALTIAEFRERWLPGAKLAPSFTSNGGAIHCTLRETEPPFLESVASFEILPRDGGGARIRIVHRLARAPAAANRNRSLLMLAA